MVGKPPHRPAGKARFDEEHRRMNKMSADDLDLPAKKDLADDRREIMARRGAPTSFPAEEQVGGSRPGVESRVKNAVEKRERRDAG
ncbi:MAG TPA: hypothetical protein VM889_08405 [Candidatus Thermoplasmatota archaeon]|nr:hypothetical protein [Candidatus Thermoplasmatota archaeon]